MSLNLDSLLNAHKVLNSLGNKRRQVGGAEEWELPNPKVRRKSIQKEVQLKKFTFQDAIFLTLATWLSNFGLGRKCTQRCHRHHIMGVFVGVAVHINTL